MIAMINRLDALREPTIKNYIERYRINKRLLNNHPEQAQLLEKKIKEAEQKIIEYFTSDNFVERMKYINI
jgi:hypothetical protein